jgi:hypothetical protein
LAEPSPDEGIVLRAGKKSVRLKPTKPLRRIDFAVGVFNDKAYLGYWQDVEICDEEDDFIKFDTAPILVFEDGRVVLYHDDPLGSMGAARATLPCLMDNWWSGKIVDVEPRSYYAAVLERFSYYIDAPPHVLHFLSVWTIGTVFHDLFQAYPILFLHGVKRSGKTKTLTLVKLMGFNGVRSHSMSPATIYRLVESAHATFLLDEQDYLADPERKGEFRTLLLGGYKRGSFVYRSEKTSSGKIVPTRFRIYSPKALANIEGLEDVLQDRAITVTMMRSTDPEKTRREPDEEDPAWLRLRDQLASLYLRHWREVAEMYRAASKALGDREDYGGVPEACRSRLGAARAFIYSRTREIWLPVIAVALFFESKGVAGVLDAVLKVAEENAAERRADEAETPEVGLVYALRKVYDGDGWYALADIHAAYKEETGLERVDVRTVGRLMKRVGLKRKRRVAGRTQYYVTKAFVDDLAARLGVEEEAAGAPPYTGGTAHTQQTLLATSADARGGGQATGGVSSGVSEPPAGNSTREPEGLLARALDFAYRRRGEFTLGELTLALGASVGEAKRAAESLARQGLLVKVDETTFRAAKNV